MAGTIVWPSVSENAKVPPVRSIARCPAPFHPSELLISRRGPGSATTQSPSGMGVGALGGEWSARRLEETGTNPRRMRHCALVVGEEAPRRAATARSVRMARVARSRSGSGTRPAITVIRQQLLAVCNKQTVSGQEESHRTRIQAGAGRGGHRSSTATQQVHDKKKSRRQTVDSVEECVVSWAVETATG